MEKKDKKVCKNCGEEFSYEEKSKSIDTAVLDAGFCCEICYTGFTEDE